MKYWFFSGISGCEDEKKVAGDISSEQDNVANISDIGADCVPSNVSFLPESEDVPELPIVTSICEERALAEMAERR